MFPSGCMDARMGTQPFSAARGKRPPVFLPPVADCRLGAALSAACSPASRRALCESHLEELELNHKLRRHQDEASKPVRIFCTRHDEQYGAFSTRWRM